MEFLALLMVGESLDGSEPVGLGQVGGISLLERQARMVLKAGAAELLLVAPALPAELGARLSDDRRIVRVPTAAALAERLAGEQRPVLMFVPGLLADERLAPALLADGRAPLVATFESTPPPRAERLDATSHSAGAALLPADLVRQVAAGLGDWELSGTLIRAACESGAARMAIEADVPIVPHIIWGAQRIWTKGRPRNMRRPKVPIFIHVGEPIYPTLPAAELTALLHARMQHLLSEVQDRYPEHPAGEFWVPHRLGGGAPTLAEADQMDLDEAREKAARRAARQAEGAPE